MWLCEVWGSVCTSTIFTHEEPRDFPPAAFLIGYSHCCAAALRGEFDPPKNVEVIILCGTDCAKIERDGLQYGQVRLWHQLHEDGMGEWHADIEFVHCRTQSVMTTFS